LKIKSILDKEISRKIKIIIEKVKLKRVLLNKEKKKREKGKNIMKIM
jgi:hypothetical protein